jgi:hypothetical protein
MFYVESPLDPPYVNEPVTLRMIRDANRRARERHPEGKLQCEFCGGWYYRFWQHQQRQHRKDDPESAAREAARGDGG